MRTLNNPVVKQAAEAMKAAFKSGDEKQLNQAWEQFHQSVCDTVRQDFETSHGDQKVLAERGYRMLTNEETTFYQKWIEGAKSMNPKQALTDLINIDGGMPQTIIEDVYTNLVNEHPLLDAISFVNVSYMTKWIMNDHTVQTAEWGQLNSDVTKELSSSFKILEMAQNKLTCFVILPKDMLDLGPVYLDAYVRTILKDAIAVGLENAIVAGDGKDKPIGLNRNISKTASVQDGKYPEKDAVKVTNFLPSSYGNLVSQLCKTEKGTCRKIEDLSLICNPVDYYKKVMPATTVLNSAGTYTGNIFPVPTNVYQSAELDEGKAILCLPKEYFAGLGSQKEGTITYDDSTQFLEDNRVYMAKLYANGKAYDNTVSVVLDISELDPAYITVLNKTDAPTV